MVREALWCFWEHCRIPRPSIQLKYSLAFPWSPLARAQFDNGQAISYHGLILEHLHPKGEIAVDLIVKAYDLTSAKLVDILHDRLRYAVITDVEDNQITRAGHRASSPRLSDRSDPWARHRDAGLDTSAYTPITSADFGLGLFGYPESIPPSMPATG